MRRREVQVLPLLQRLSAAAVAVEFNLIGIGQQQPTIWQQSITKLIKLSHRPLKSHFELYRSPARIRGRCRSRRGCNRNRD